MNDHADTQHAVYVLKVAQRLRAELSAPEREALDAAIAALEAGRSGEADELLRDWGLDPERFRSEGGHLNPGKIRAALLHPDDYDELYLSGWSYFKRPFRVVERGETLYVEDSGSMSVMLQWPQHPAEETELAERETWRLGEAFVNAANAAAPQQPPPVGVTAAMVKRAAMALVVAEAYPNLPPYYWQGLLEKDRAKYEGWALAALTAALSHQQPAPSESGDRVVQVEQRDGSVEPVFVPGAPSVSGDRVQKLRRYYEVTQTGIAMTKMALMSDDPAKAKAALDRMSDEIDAVLDAPVSEPAASGEGLLPEFPPLPKCWSGSPVTVTWAEDGETTTREVYSDVQMVQYAEAYAKEAIRRLTTTGWSLDEAAIRRAVRAHDREDAAQKGEPDPWDEDFPEPYYSERMTSMRLALEAAGATTGQGDVEAGSVWTENVFSGPPPQGYPDWNTWAGARVRTGAFIRQSTPDDWREFLEGQQQEGQG